MAIGGGMSCVKYLLFCFNLLFAVTGLIILIAGLKAYFDMSPYKDFTSSSVFIILIMVGIVVFVVSFLGCCGVAKENNCMILCFATLLGIIFLIELGVGIAEYKNHYLSTTVERQLNNTIKNYTTDPFVKNIFDVMQTDLECCGFSSPDDWKQNNLTIPSSCCSHQEVKDNGVLETCTENSVSFHKEGCRDKLVNFIDNEATVLSAICLGIAGVQLLGVILVCSLARSIRSQYETV